MSDEKKYEKVTSLMFCKNTLNIPLTTEMLSEHQSRHSKSVFTSPYLKMTFKCEACWSSGRNMVQVCRTNKFRLANFMETPN